MDGLNERFGGYCVFARLHLRPAPRPYFFPGVLVVALLPPFLMDKLIVQSFHDFWELLKKSRLANISLKALPDSPSLSCTTTYFHCTTYRDYLD